MTKVAAKDLAEFAHDVQLALPRTDLPEMAELKELGMAATLAINLRGLPEIPYERLKLVSDHFFDVPSYALKTILAALAEVEFIDIIGPVNNPTSIIPKVPFFEDIFENLGSYASVKRFNEHEQAAVAILQKLFESPHNKDSLRSKLGMDNTVFERCLTIYQQGRLAEEKRARGKSILVSPLYFADNLQNLADIAATHGSSEFQRVINLIKTHQGWPLSLIEKTKEIAGYKLTDIELQIVKALSQEMILKPPSIRGSAGDSLHFLFTPKPGPTRLNAANRETYERAMALVSTVRKGQLLPDAYKIHSPRALLGALKDRGKIRPSTEARLQYDKLVQMRIGTLVPASGGWSSFELLRNQENEAALDLAIELVSSGNVSGMSANPDAQTALQRDEKYIHHLIAASKLRERPAAVMDEEVKKSTMQLVFGFVK